MKTDFQWNQKDQAGFSVREVLENAEKYKSWVVESFMTKALLEIMEILEAEEQEVLPPAPAPKVKHR